MFIGPTASQSGAGGTELECNFPANIGQGPNPQFNCDISIVDDYSLSLACTGPEGELFYNSDNLWMKATRPVMNGEYCTNSQGYAGSQDNVDQFLNAYPDYWIWVMGQTTQINAIFTQHGTVKWKGSGGKPAAQKKKRENDEASLLALDEMQSMSDSAARHRHEHKGRAHARGWCILMRGFKP